MEICSWNKTSNWNLQALNEYFMYNSGIVPGENELFQSYPCFFQDLTLCTACLLLQYY